MRVFPAVIFTVLVAVLFSAETASASETIEKLKLTVFERKNSLLPWRIFPLSPPEKGRPFSGYFLSNTRIDLRMQWSDGYTTMLKMNPQPVKYQRKANNSVKPPLNAVSTVFHGGKLALSNFPISAIYLKPNLDKIGDDKLNSLKIGNYAKNTPVLYHLKIERTNEGAAFYFNGSYGGTLRRNGAYPVSLVLAANSNEQFADLSRPETETPGFFPIDIDMRSRHELSATLNLSGKIPIPMRTNVKRALDLRNSYGSSEQMHNLYRCLDLTRSAFDGLPMSYMFSVPLKQYCKAWILCAPLDSADKPTFRLAVTRYNDLGRSQENIAFSDIDLSQENSTVKKVGTSEIILDGKKVRKNLYLAEVPIDSAKIQELIFHDPHSALEINDYLDIDLQSVSRYDKIRFPRKQGVSAPVAVFGITLEETPATVKVGQTEFGNVFYNYDNPTIPVDITSPNDGEYIIKWIVKDIDGKTLIDKSSELYVSAGEKSNFQVPLEKLSSGWFSILITIAKKGGKPFYKFDGSAVILPPDTRQAGFESPYATWFEFRRGHNSAVSDPEKVLGFLQKAGFRSVNGTAIAEKDLKKWGFTLSQIPEFWRKIYTDERIIRDDPELWKKMDNNFKSQLDHYVKNFPSCKQIIMMHESYSGQYPLRPNIMVGKKAPVYDTERENLEKARVKAMNRACAIIRKHYPDMQIILGNSCWAQGIIEAFLHRGLDCKLFDAIGSEAVCGRRLPESFESTWTTAGSAYVLRETARLYGADKPVTGCYEWSCRTAEQGELRQAQLYIRDAITAHSFNFKKISLGGAIDPGTAYNHDPGYGHISFANWQRQPRPAYAAAATMTRIVDQVKFQGALPTNDPAVNCFYFTRNDGKNIYVIWSPVDSAEAELIFDDKERCEISSEDLFGRPAVHTIQGGSCPVSVNGSVRYFVLDKKIKMVKVVKVNSRFTREPEGKIAGTHKLTSKSFTPNSNKESRFDVYDEKPSDGIYGDPTFPALVKIADNRHGVQINFDLTKVPDDPWNRSAYTKLVFNEPLTVPANANRLGIWVQGNQSRGRIIWEITDNMGRKYLSNGNKKNGGFSLNEAYQNNFAYKGWRFLWMPLSKKYAEPVGWFGYQWCSTDGKSAAAMKRPFRITAIYLSTTKKLDRVFEMVPVKDQTIILGEIKFYQ